jgi:hypothetical protein
MSSSKREASPIEESKKMCTAFIAVVLYSPLANSTRYIARNRWKVSGTRSLVTGVNDYPSQYFCCFRFSRWTLCIPGALDCVFPSLVHPDFLSVPLIYSVMLLGSRDSSWLICPFPSPHWYHVIFCGFSPRNTRDTQHHEYVPGVPAVSWITYASYLFHYPPNGAFCPI